MRLRYNHPIPDLPSYCVCKDKLVYTVQHAQQCSRGGFINERHDSLRDFFTVLLDKVCNGVKAEPHLTSLSRPPDRPATAIHNLSRLCRKVAGLTQLTQLSYSLNKVEFRDSIFLRYGWEIPNTPRFCSCGKRNSLNHILNCKNGGYANYRHDNVRNAIAEYLRQICKDVTIEPHLIPIEAEQFQQKGNNADKARLDIAARGLWSTFERTLTDVRIFNPNSESYLAQTLAQLYIQQENQKKRQYLNRVLQVEKGSFSPLVFTTTGGMAPKANRFLKRVAEKISAKTREKYSQVMSNIRTRISFEIMRSVLVAVRGARGKIRQAKADPISTIAFNLIPEARSYECP